MASLIDSDSGRRAQWRWLLLAGVAFGFIEAAVVVYLRALAYPEGFDFPLSELQPRIVGVEILREFATLLLLVGIAQATRARPLARFGVFALLFGVWDLVFYLMLKLLLGWPASWLAWDVLFLIPVPWLAPVLAPALVALALVVCATPILLAPETRRWDLRPRDWLLEIVAGLLILASFFTETERVLAGGRPERFLWWLFGAGLGLGLGVYLAALRRSLRASRDG